MAAQYRSCMAKFYPFISFLNAKIFASIKFLKQFATFTKSSFAFIVHATSYQTAFTDFTLSHSQMSSGHASVNEARH